jgi:ribosomal protein L14
VKRFSGTVPKTHPNNVQKNERYIKEYVLRRKKEYDRKENINLESNSVGIIYRK